MQHDSHLARLTVKRHTLKQALGAGVLTTMHLQSMSLFLALLLFSGTFGQTAEPRSSLTKVTVAKDDFVCVDGAAYVPFGVNYFRPATGWAPKLWRQFDAEATHQDLLRLKKMGGNCVRVFLSFGSFYNEPGVLDTNGLAKLDEFLAIAEQAGVYVHPTGPDHWEGTPSWAQGDRLAEERVLRALEQFWTLLAARYRNRNVIFAYDLLNEPSVRWESDAMRERWSHWVQAKYKTAAQAAQEWKLSPDQVDLQRPPVPPAKDAPGSRHLLDYQLFREDVADEWTRRQAAAIKAADPQALVTVGLIQWSVPALLPGVQHYAAYRPARQAKFLDFMEVHFYPLEHGFYEYADAASETKNLAYFESVVREVARTGKPVVVAEFGWYGGGKLTINNGKHPAASEEQQARWCRRLVETSRPFASGWLNWGFYDHPEARDVTQLTGLLTADGKEKAWGKVFHELAPLVTRGSTRKLPDRVDLPWNDCLTSMAAARKFRESYHDAFSAR